MYLGGNVDEWGDLVCVSRRFKFRGEIIGGVSCILQEVAEMT